MVHLMRVIARGSESWGPLSVRSGLAQAAADRSHTQCLGLPEPALPELPDTRQQVAARLQLWAGLAGAPETPRVVCRSHPRPSRCFQFGVVCLTRRPQQSRSPDLCCKADRSSEPHPGLRVRRLTPPLDLTVQRWRWEAWGEWLRAAGQWRDTAVWAADLPGLEQEVGRFAKLLGAVARSHRGRL